MDKLKLKLKLNEGAQYLGRGVNAFEASYPINEQQFKDPIITDVAGLITEIPRHSTDMEETYGACFEEFSHKLTGEAGLKGNCGFFTASLEGKFTRSSCQSTTTQFLRQATVVSVATLSVGEDPVVLREYLTPAFKNALENDSPRDLFDAYGTHLAVKVNIGGRAEYICHSLESETKTQQEFEASARAKFRILAVSVGGSAKVTKEDEESATHVEGDSNLTAYGGDAKHRQAIEGGAKETWADWAESVEKLPAFMGFPKDGLLPIWKLTDDNERQEDLKLAFRQLAACNMTVRVLSFEGSESDQPEAQIVVPNHYKLLSGGALIDQNDGVWLLTASYPGNDNTWRALGGYSNGSAAHATMTAYAVAVYDPDDIWEVKSEHQESGKETNPCCEMSLGKPLQGPDFVMIGGGAGVDPAIPFNSLTDSHPKDPTTEDLNTWVARAKRTSGTDSFRLTSYVIGLRCKVDGVTIERDIRYISSQQEFPQKVGQAVEASTASEYTMVGGGVKIEGRGGNTTVNTLIASYPKAPTTPETPGTWVTIPYDITAKDDTISTYAVGIKVNLPADMMPCNRA